MKYALLIDFGSTFTKAVVVSIPDKKVVFTTKTPSTVASDATICLERCLTGIREEIGAANTEEAVKLASSSAAGGLRMAVSGLTPSLSIAAGRNVSFGAGAKIVHVASGELGEDDLARIMAQRAEIVLLCGGYEGGNETTLLHNARELAASELACPVLFAGNSHVASAVERIFGDVDKQVLVVGNVMPQVGVYDAGPAEQAIRSIFMQRIVNMKGLGAVRARLGSILMPTPAAVLHAGELLSRGSPAVPGMGDLLILDIGGATTDIHSFAEHTVLAGARSIGAAEPYAKRTVEGDLGMRESSDTLCQEAGYESVAASAGLSVPQLRHAVAHRVQNIDYVPDSWREARLDHVLAQSAARLASRRHAGRIERVVASNCSRLQRGKNLTSVRSVLGTGGVIVNSEDANAILRGVLAAREEDVLLPVDASLYVDAEYVLFALGLLRTFDEDLALGVMKNTMRAW